VLGQSHSEGWKATVGGDSLGAPRLVDGYANGWLVRPDRESFDVVIEWTPRSAGFSTSVQPAWSSAVAALALPPPNAITAPIAIATTSARPTAPNTRRRVRSVPPRGGPGCRDFPWGRGFGGMVEER